MFEFGEVMGWACGVEAWVQACGDYVLWVFPTWVLAFIMIVFGCLEVVGGGIHAHGEKVETCVGFLQRAKVAEEEENWVGKMICSLWLPMYCPYHRLSVCVVPTYVHLGGDRNQLEMVECLRGLLSHLATYERWRRMVVMDWHLHQT